MGRVKNTNNFIVFLIFFILLLSFGLQASSAEPEVKYNDLDGSYILRFAPDMTPRIIHPLSLSTHRHGLSGKNNEGFFSQNFNITMRNLNPSKLGELSNAKAISISNEFQVSEAFNIIGNFESEIPERIDSEIEDYSLRVGPSIETEDFKLQVIYNRIVPGGLLPENQGFYFNLDYRPWKFVSLSTDVDKKWTGISTTTHGLVKLTISPLSLASVVTGMEFNDGGSYTKMLTTEIKKFWNDIETWMKGGLIHREARADQNQHFAEFGLNYGLFRDLDLQLKNSYEKYNSYNNESEQIKFGGGINFKLPLPLGMEFQNSLNVNKTIEDEDINYQFMSSITIPR